MEPAARPWRSLLYIPASKPRAMDKARGLPCDAVIFDLEDAVAPAEKVAARETLRAALETGGFGRRARLIRVNGAATEWGAGDVRMAARAPIEAVLLPKVESPDDVAVAAGMLEEAGSDAAVWAMVETPAGVLNAAAIARAPRMGGFVIGTNDLAKELGCLHRSDRLSLMFALQSCLLAARAAGIVCIDGVFNAFRDEVGLADECRQGRELGMDGKTVIHPAQIEAANRTFAPTDDEVATARAQIQAFDGAMAKGQAVAVLDGRIVENLHVETARATLARADAIARMESE